MTNHTPRRPPARPAGATIKVERLVKRFGATVAVDGLSFEIRPGRVTGFLGPNGAGKSTTLRMILGLDTPTEGLALIGGRPYRSLEQPLRTVGSLLDAAALHGGRSARNHLEILAAANDLPRNRVESVLERTGLAGVAAKRVKGFSPACASGRASRRRCSASRRSGGHLWRWPVCWRGAALTAEGAVRAAAGRCQLQLMRSEVTTVQLRVALSLAGLRSTGVLAVRVAVTA
jgi:ABC-type transport system involved in cytochrome c biogenesis ATPase subunit